MFSWSKWHVKVKQCCEETVYIWTNAESSEETIAPFGRQQRKRHGYVVNVIGFCRGAGKSDFHLYQNITKKNVLTFFTDVKRITIDDF